MLNVFPATYYRAESDITTLSVRCNLLGNKHSQITDSGWPALAVTNSATNAIISLSNICLWIEVPVEFITILIRFYVPNQKWFTEWYTVTALRFSVCFHFKCINLKCNTWQFINNLYVSDILAVLQSTVFHQFSLKVTGFSPLESVKVTWGDFYISD